MFITYIIKKSTIKKLKIEKEEPDISEKLKFSKPVIVIFEKLLKFKFSS